MHQREVEMKRYSVDWIKERRDSGVWGFFMPEKGSHHQNLSMYKKLYGDVRSIKVNGEMMVLFPDRTTDAINEQ